MALFGFASNIAAKQAAANVGNSGIIKTVADAGTNAANASNGAINGGASSYAGNNNANMQNQYSGASGAINNMSGAAGDLSGISGTVMNNYNSTYMPAIGRASQLANVSEEEAAGKASVDTGLSYDNALGTNQRVMSRMGVNPNSGRFAGMQAEWGLAKAAAIAAAKNNARKQARNESFSRNASIAGISSHGASQAIGAASSAANAYGNAAQLGMGLGDRYSREADQAGYVSGRQNNAIGNGANNNSSRGSSGLWNGATSLNDTVGTFKTARINKALDDFFQD
jgi:hypothetical protein